MERLERIKDCLIMCVEHEIAKGLEYIDAEELGEAIDMIKDLEEAIYHCKASEMLDDEKRYKKHEAEAMKEWQGDYGAVHPTMPRNTNDIPGDRGAAMTTGGGRGGYFPEDNEWYGKSYHKRKEYLEAKHTYGDKEESKKKLEDYARDLGNDIMEMLKESTPEEKQIIQQKLGVLVNKLK